MQAYSMDLRERALLDSDAGMKAAAVAVKYRVSGSWVRLLKQRRRETGDVAAARPAARAAADAGAPPAHPGRADRGATGSHLSRAEGRARHAGQFGDDLARGGGSGRDRQKKRSGPPNTIDLTSRPRGSCGTPPHAVQPFVFETKHGGVDVFLTVGFTRAIPSAEEAADESAEKRYSSEDAGWTVLCNDRAVLFCDKSEMTGWGEASPPRYHTQFIAISGVVEFRASDPALLPTTTTKRGIDASSPLYLQVKNKMRQGLSQFTNFTYRWKGREPEARDHIERGTPLSLQQLKARAKTLQLRATKQGLPAGNQYTPKLPLPARLRSTQRRVSFVRDIEEIKTVARHLFDDDGVTAAKVGEECFGILLAEAKE